MREMWSELNCFETENGDEVLDNYDGKNIYDKMLKHLLLFLRVVGNFCSKHKEKKKFEKTRRKKSN